MKKISVLVVIASSCLFFTSFFQGIQEDKPVPIPPGKQRLGGDRLKGYEYLITGDYIKSGIPYDVFLLTRGKNKDNLLGRTGLNSKLSYPYTATKAFNGKIVVVPNCLQCHAQVFDNQLIIGLGNSMIDFTINQKLNPKSLRSLEKMLKNNLPRQYEAAATFIDVAKIATQFLTTEVRGVNSADRLAEVLAAHRDPVTFKWSKEPMLEIPSEVIPSDTPPWWLLKKKNAMFYNGFGRGDFGRFLMASNLLTVNDTAEAREVDFHMPDVLAYIYSIKPPQYPKPIDMTLAKEGQLLFQNNCSKCHGDYSETGSYPNLLIPESIIRTDSFLYKSNYSNPQFVQWFNNSWFTRGDHPAKLEPFNGYIAPPLDGIWITAPFLHNGSVPSLEVLLNSAARPRYWSRDFQNPEYDYETVGWKFTVHEKPGGQVIYNTDLKGYGNYGHYFGDVLTNGERRAVIEYLKTL